MAVDSKRRLLFFLALAGIAIALVAASLPRLELKPGMPLPSLTGGQFVLPAGPESPPLTLQAKTFLLTFLGILLAVCLVIVVYQAIRGIGWKKLASSVIKYLVIIVAAVGLLALFMSVIPSSNNPIYEDQAVLPAPQIATAPLGPPPPILIWLVGAGLAIGAALLGVWIYRSRNVPGQAALRLGQEAEKARQALLSGMSLRDVILQCYRQMSQVLQEERGIERQAFMTTGEFERLLKAQGFPAEPVHHLTHLFDAVRYGRWQPGLNDDQQAIDCLEAIVRYSREAQQEG